MRLNSNPGLEADVSFQEEHISFSQIISSPNWPGLKIEVQDQQTYSGMRGKYWFRLGYQCTSQLEVLLKILWLGRPESNFGMCSLSVSQ